MKTQRFTLTLTVINSLILITALFLFITSIKTDVVSIVRAHAIELIDENGKVRAEIKVLAAEPTLKMPDGTVEYTETVLFRLFDSKGRAKCKNQCYRRWFGGLYLEENQDTYKFCPELPNQL